MASPLPPRTHELVRMRLIPAGAEPAPGRSGTDASLDVKQRLGAVLFRCLVVRGR